MLTEGIWDCKVLSAKAGEIDGGIVAVQINVEWTTGPDTGKRGTYEDQINANSAQYVVRSMKAVGWRGPKPSTLEADCAAWVAKTGGASTVEVKHIPIKNGRKAGQIWDKINAIGRQAARPLAAASKAADDAAADLLTRAAQASSDWQDDVPHAAAAEDDRIPF